VSVVEDETPSDTLATTPFATGVGFEPHNTQVVTPEALLQETTLDAAMAAGPAVTETEEKSVVE
jgi:hypothetical protein